MKRLKGLVALAFMVSAMLMLGTKASAAPAQVTGVKQSAGQKQTATVAWNTVSGTNVKYEIQCSLSSDLDDSTTVTSISSSNKVVIPDLQMGTTYYVRIRAFVGGEYGAYSSIVSIVTAPGAISDLQQINATTKGPIISWSGASGANNYHIYIGNKYIGATSKTKYEFKVTPKDDIYVYAVRKTTGFNAVGEFKILPSTDIKIRPKKIKKVKATRFLVATKDTYIEWEKDGKADGYQVKYYVYNKKKAIETLNVSAEATLLDDVTLDKFYKVKVRGYCVIDGKKKYGDWSKEMHFAFAVDNPELKKVSSKYIYADWSDIKGTTNYTIYVSTKITSGYKKVGTSKKSSFTIKKYNGKPLVHGVDYYVTIVAVRKVDGKKYKTALTTGTYLPYGF